MSEAAVVRDLEMNNAVAAREPAALLPLSVNGLRFSANGKDIIRGIDLEISGAGTTVVMGSNGAGKSVFLRLLHGLLPPTSGSVSWNGRPPDDSVRVRQAMVFQRPVLLRRSVLANVRFALAMRGLSAGDAQARETLRLAGLETLAGQPARVLSGGEQQRLSIARALSLKPDVLFLDEPAASLDPASLLAIEELVATARGRGVKVILVSHDIAHARRLADEIVFMHGGRVAELTPADRFFASPESEQAQAYLDGRIFL